MSCTHNCGCTEQNRDASLDEWPTTAWLQGRATKEASEDASEAPQEVQLAPGPSEPVFIDPSTLAPGRRIVRVFTEDKPVDTDGAGALPVLPRRIKPEDVRAGMMVEQRKGESYVGGRVIAIEDGMIKCEVVWLHINDERNGWSLWLIEDAPAPVDPDAAVVELMARVAHDQDCVEGDWDEHGEGTRQAWRKDARAVLAALRETHDVTPRAEQ